MHIKDKKKFGNSLSIKEKRYADEYVNNGGNGTKAIIDAGYKCKNNNVAGVISYENLRKPKIQAYLNEKGNKAGKVIETLMNTSGKDEVRLKSAIFIYEQVYGKAVQKIIGDKEQPLIQNQLKLTPEQLERLAHIILDRKNS